MADKVTDCETGAISMTLAVTVGAIPTRGTNNDGDIMLTDDEAMWLIPKVYGVGRVSLIPGFSRYGVSDCGSVFSWRINITEPWIHLRKLKANKHTKTRKLTVTLRSDDNKAGYCYVSHLVINAFVGPKPESEVKQLVRHLDDDQENNHYTNLAWGTIQDNADDATRNGNRVRGSRVGTSKLCEKAVKDIRDKFREGISVDTLLSVYKVHLVTLMNIIKRRSWKHVK